MHGRAAAQAAGWRQKRQADDAGDNERLEHGRGWAIGEIGSAKVGSSVGAGAGTATAGRRRNLGQARVLCTGRERGWAMAQGRWCMITC